MCKHCRHTGHEHAPGVPLPHVDPLLAALEVQAWDFIPWLSRFQCIPEWCVLILCWHENIAAYGLTCTLCQIHTCILCLEPDMWRIHPFTSCANNMSASPEAWSSTLFTHSSLPKLAWFSTVIGMHSCQLISSSRIVLLCFSDCIPIVDSHPHSTFRNQSRILWCMYVSAMLDNKASLRSAPDQKHLTLRGDFWDTAEPPPNPIPPHPPLWQSVLVGTHQTMRSES